MRLETWHIILIIIIIILLIWYFSRNTTYEFYQQNVQNKPTRPEVPLLADQYLNSFRNNYQVYNQNIHTNSNFNKNNICGTNIITQQTLIKLFINHMFYERLLMVSYYTNKSKLPEIQTKLINNSQEFNQFIKRHYPKLSPLSDFIDRIFMGDIEPYFELIYQLFETIRSGSENQQLCMIRKINGFVNNIAVHIDKLLGTNIFQKYVPEYMKLYIANLYSFLSGNQFEDTQYTQAMFNIGIDMMFNLINN